jgi:hypothetical protein
MKLVEEATWLSPIVVILKKTGKLKIYVDFRKLNATTNNTSKNGHFAISPFN